MGLERMVPPKSGKLDKYLTGPPRNKAHANAQRWYLRLYQQTPPWAPRKAILAIYRQARGMRDNGVDVQVDHLVPLNHPQVSGLHVPWNLKIVSKQFNAYKSNKFWPGYYFGQEDFIGKIETEQGELPFHHTLSPTAV